MLKFHPWIKSDFLAVRDVGRLSQDKVCLEAFAFYFGPTYKSYV